MADEPTHPAGVPVVIVLAYQGEEQDHTRIGRLEHHPKSDARRMVANGEARWLDDPRNIDDGWPIRDTGKADDTDERIADLALRPADAPNPLDVMSKTELRAASTVAAGLPPDATRHELLAAARGPQPATVPPPTDQP